MFAKLAELDHVVGNTIIRFVEDDPATLEVDAVVEEQDTHHLLGQSPVVKVVIESFPALITKMEEQIPEEPGNIIVKLAQPMLLIAIVYDVEKNPIVQEDWIEKAVLNILAYCEKNRIKTLAMPLLGAAYSGIHQQKTFEILQNSLMKNRNRYPGKILVYELPVQ